MSLSIEHANKVVWYSLRSFQKNITIEKKQKERKSVVETKRKELTTSNTTIYMMQRAILILSLVIAVNIKKKSPFRLIPHFYSFQQFFSLDRIFCVLLRRKCSLLLVSSNFKNNTFFTCKNSHKNIPTQ